MPRLRSIVLTQQSHLPFGCRARFVPRSHIRDLAKTLLHGRVTCPPGWGYRVGVPDPLPRAFLDATQSPMNPVARDTLVAASERGWADPTRLYTEARSARRLLDQAREVLAAALGVRPAELSFAPSGPVAIRCAIDGVRHARRRHGQGLLTTAIDHSSVLRVARHPEPDGAQRSRILPVDDLGRVDLDQWQAALSDAPLALAITAAANAEVGTTAPVTDMWHAARRAGVPLAIDRMASLGRLATDADISAGEVMVADARSFGGPPGVGLLAVRDGTRFRRSGPAIEAEFGRVDVEPHVPLALAAAEAWRQHEAHRDADARSAAELIDRLRRACAAIPDSVVAGPEHERLPHIMTASFLFADGESLVSDLDRRGIAVASGSACTASTLEPSHVLAAMGVLTHGNIRVTLPTLAVAPDRERGVQRLIAELPGAVERVRAGLGAGAL